MDGEKKSHTKHAGTADSTKCCTWYCYSAGVRQAFVTYVLHDARGLISAARGLILACGMQGGRTRSRAPNNC